MLPVALALPTPPALWQALPTAVWRREALGETGETSGWSALSLTPSATAEAALSIVPAIAIFVGVRQLAGAQKRAVLLCFLAFAVVSVFLGFAQLAGGPTSALRFFHFTNPTEAVGFFANRNHFAALLYVSILMTAPFVGDLVLGFLQSNKANNLAAARIALSFVGLTLIFLLLVALILARSRAGVLLGLVGLAMVATLLLSDERNRWRRQSLIAIGVAVFAAFGFASSSGVLHLTDRFNESMADDARVVIAERSVAMAKAVFPTGSGLGSFETLYAAFERPQQVFANTFVNAAHDDWLQILVETGVFGALGLALFAVWLVARGAALTRPRPAKTTTLDMTLTRSAYFGVVLLALHSFVDYPLRTEAGAVIFALCAALSYPPGRAHRDEAEPFDDEEMELAS